MQISLAVFVLALATIASAGHYYHHDDHHDYHSPAHYTYEYKVHDPHTGDIKSQHESRQGDAVKGYYMLHEADGTIREVHYTADKHSGFNAVVKNHGHPVVHHHVAAPVHHHEAPVHHQAFSHQSYHHY